MEELCSTPSYENLSLLPLIHWLSSPVDGGTVELSEDIDIAYPITCGDSKAVLLWKKFVCPGINVKCVKVIG